MYCTILYIYIKLYVHSLQISRETSIPQPTIPPTRLHPTPPMCTKHHGLLKAVVQLDYTLNQLVRVVAEV